MKNLFDKNKTNWLKITRRVIQILSLIFMPGLFLSTFMAIKSIYVSVITGTFSFSLQLSSVLLLLAVIPITIFLGRFFCGYLCSFGALGDLFWFLTGKIFKKKIKISEKADRILKYFKYVLLLFIVIFIWTLGAVKVESSWNPWSVFGMYTSLSGWSSIAGFLSVGGLLLLVIIIGSAFVERFFCRYMCPLGAVFAIITKIKLLKIKKPAEGCRSCKACTKGCCMGIDLYKHDMVKSGECINCMECITVCPRSNSQLTFAGKDAAPLAAGIATCVIISALYFSGKAAVQAVYTAPSQQKAYVVETEEKGPYTDGIYKGSADGYRGITTVEVTIENGYISNIAVLSTDDDMEFFLPAQNTVTSEILQAQSTDVDAVTGATFSSYAIANAVYDALTQCMGEMRPDISMGMMQTAETPEPITEEELEAIAANPALSELEDGVYTGTGRGYYGDTVVDVTLESGKIIAIEVVSTADDRPYLEKAETVTDDVIQTQDVTVDTVSGATVSSNGILEAIADALGLDYIRAAEEEGGHGGGQRRGGGGGGH